VCWPITPSETGEESCTDCLAPQYNRFGERELPVPSNDCCDVASLGAEIVITSRPLPSMTSSTTIADRFRHLKLRLRSLVVRVSVAFINHIGRL
jgi:hypothetical protein